MSTNSIIEQMNALSFDEEKKKQREKYKTDMQADIDLSNAGYDSQINSMQNYYDKQIGDAKIAYDTEYQKNAVQKLINEKKIAETNANLGLTDSGLNRTQQTAAQLSYANQKGKIDLARQSALDNLTLAMTDAITTLQNQKAASARDITKQWNDYADIQAQNIYNTKYNGYVDMHNAQVEADAAVQKAAIEASAKAPNVSYGAGGTSNGNYILQTSGGLLSRDFTGSLADNNINVIYNNDGTTTYVDNNSGKKTTLDSDINPYTGTRNNDVDYGAFSNGYQPNNVKGEKLFATKYDKVEVYDGSPQTVFKTKSNDKLWIWDAARNDYIDYREFMGVKDWDAGDWEGYFATVRNIDGRAAAEEELLFYSNNGLLPDDMMYFARIGAQGSFGH